MKNSASYGENLLSLIISTYQYGKMRKKYILHLFYSIWRSLLLFFKWTKVNIQSFTSTGKHFLNSHTKANCRHIGDNFFCVPKSTLYIHASDSNYLTELEPLLTRLSLQPVHGLTAKPTFQGVFLGSAQCLEPTKHAVYWVALDH